MKHWLSRRDFRAMATFIGAIIGAGIFGVPFVFAQSGAVIGILHLVVLAVVMFFAQLFYAHLTIAVPGRHRFPGFAGALLGRAGKDFAGFLAILAGWAVLTVYIIIGGTFLYELLGPWIGGVLVHYQLVFAATSLFVVHGGLRGVGKSESVMTTLLILVLIIIIGFAFSKLDAARLMTLDTSKAFLPYGVVLFAIAGLTVVPELEDLLGPKEARLHFRRVIGFGVLISAGLTLLFGLAVLGATGAATTPEAISGLGAVLGRPVVIAGALFGLLAIITSFFTNLMNQQEVFAYDFKIKPGLAWILSIGVPLIIFIAGSRNFISMIGLTGGVFAGLIGALTMIMYAVLQKKTKTPRWRMIGPLFLAFFFIAGAIAELFSFYA